MEFFANLLFAIVFGGLGVIFLITPYEKLQEKFPKLRLKTPKMVKIVGIILIAGVVFSLL